MKLNRFQCDRCGKKYDANKTFDITMGEKHRLVGVGLLNVNKNIHRFDLCDECLDELQEWLSHSSHDCEGGTDC